MKKETIEIRVLTASDGMILTDGNVYSTKVYLGIHDSPENWREVPEDEADQTRKENLDE